MSDPISKLLNACEGGDLETIKSLLSPPVPVAAPAATNETPSHPMQDGTDSDESEDEEFDSMAMFHGYSHQIEKAHTECRDRWKISPLGAAIMGQQLEVVDLLLSLDANANGVIENSSLIHYTCAIGGIGGTMSHSFAEACIQKLMAAGARIDARDEFLRTPLHIAAASGLHNCIALLSGSTEQTHINVQDNRGQTALHVAARNSNHACISELLSCDANKTLQDHRGRTASHHAAEIGDQKGADLCKCDTDEMDGLGQTATQLLAANSPTRLPTLVVYPHQSIEHKTAVSIDRGKAEPPPENEQRIHVLVNERYGTLRASEFDGRVKWDEQSPRANLADILRVHDHLYVNMVKTRCEGCEPIDAPTQAKNKLSQLDMDTVMSRESYEAAMYAAGAACHAVDQIMAKECQNAFCVVRPPGHHAGPRGVVTAEDDPDGGSHGFCLFNNVAVAAAYARHVYRHQGIQKVAILDFDVHHGNGTEALVRNLEPSMVTNTFPTLFGDVTMDSPSYKPWLNEQDSENVLFVSLHGYGNGFYPSSGRTSADKPVFNVGWPLNKDKNQASREWRQAWRNAVMPALKDFNPDMIFLSCGLDGHRKDEMNHGFVCLQETDYEWLTQQVVEASNVLCEGRIVSCLEGGYRIHGNVVSAFARSGAAHVRALASPGKTCTTDKRVAFDQQVDEEVAAKRAEEKRIAEEARAAIEELELQELKKRLAEEEQKQLAILEAEANGEAPPVVASSSSSSSSDIGPVSERSASGRRGRGAKVDYVALAARMNAEKMLKEKKDKK